MLKIKNGFGDFGSHSFRKRVNLRHIAKVEALYGCSSGQIGIKGGKVFKNNGA